MATSRIRAPEFPDSTEWINTEQPILLSNYRGKVILLDFWSYCQASCLQSQVDLQYLESKFKDGLVVIGIHSPKFSHEHDRYAVEQAIGRQQVRHPVINDSSYAMWKRFRIKQAPTLVIIDTEGYILGALSGIGRRQQVEGLIHNNLMHAEIKDIRNTAPFPFKAPSTTEKVLSYPGQVLATRNRLYISDSGHNRVLECNHEGKITRCFGAPIAGHLDGELEEASFSNPQGLEKIGDYLFVADTGNHSIRRIHIPRGDVHTVIGNGRPATVTTQDYSDPAVAQLNCPWGLHHHKGSLYISLAGSHQVWRWQLSMNHLAPVVGNGKEGLRDGISTESQFAQPCGISSRSEGLYIADASSSAIRSVRMPDIKVTTLIGTGVNDFGHIDGPANTAKLQHPMDIAYDEKRDLLWICDTFNNRLKYIQLSTNTVTSLDLEGLDEPGGLSLVDNYLWVANTNQHQVTRLDLMNGSAEIIRIHE